MKIVKVTQKPDCWAQRGQAERSEDKTECGQHHSSYGISKWQAHCERQPLTRNNNRPERMRTMKQYKEIRKIRASALRQLCIDRDWYTAGDNDEYSHLLYDLANDKENLSTADIIEIAADIMAHSDMSDDYSVESVAFEVARIADVFFEEV
jgi:hypothetical protein